MTLNNITLTPQRVFAGIAVLRMVKNTMHKLPSVINSFSETKISLDRIQSYLLAKDQKSYVRTSAKDKSIVMKQASFYWDSKNNSKNEELAETKIILKSINLKVKKGEFVAIVGKVASGKSSLLQSFIQNMSLLDTQNSKVVINGSIAYCGQEA